MKLMCAARFPNVRLQFSPAFCGGLIEAMEPR